MDSAIIAALIGGAFSLLTAAAGSVAAAKARREAARRAEEVARREVAEAQRREADQDLARLQAIIRAQADELTRAHNRIERLEGR